MEQDEAAKERPERVPAPLEETEMATEQAGAATAEAAQAAAKAAAAEEEKQHREMEFAPTLARVRFAISAAMW